MVKGPWIDLLAADPIPWLLESGEPSARWVTLTALCDYPGSHPEVQSARRQLLADPQTDRLLAQLPEWGKDDLVSSHAMPGFLPNMLNLLADMGVGPRDDDRIERRLDAMLEHQEADGHFQSYGRAAHGSKGSKYPVWGALLCDSHAIIEMLVRFGRGSDPRIQVGIQRMAADMGVTSQGLGWRCVPHSVTGFRGPGRKADGCPQVTLQAVRTFSRLPVEQRPAGLLDAVRTIARAWRRRGDEQPYMFGHGYSFKTVKWPPFWYSVYWVLDTIGRYPEIWQAPGADPDDRRAVAEMAACLVAYNFGPDGRVTPRSCYKGFEDYSFGQKKQPSPFATAILASVLRRFNDLTGDIEAVDVLALGSSRGGSGTPRAPAGIR
ncbi:MAG: hypothetical protein HPY55_04915 [Firmicutes bacterium]|nr:hypothetical protein [Bacillota bacterium]